MNGPPRPTRPLFWLLRKLSSRAAANAAVGDVLDELAARASAGRAPRWPRMWVNVQAITLAMAFATAVTPRLLRSAWYTLRDAARSLRRSPGYSALVIALLALGMAAGTVTFSVVDAVVLRPLAIEGGDRLVSIGVTDAKRKRRISTDEWSAIRDRVSSLASLGRDFGGDSRAVVMIGGDTDEVTVMRVSSDALFQVLRFRPVIGRVWSAEEESQGQIDVTVLGYRYWRDHFRGDPSVLGQVVTYGKERYRVIGVLDAATEIPGLRYSESQLYVPGSPAWKEFALIGRMRPGVSPVQIAEEIQRVIGTADWRPSVVPLLDSSVERVRGWMLLALGAAALVVLIACVNAANIMLTRSLRRAQELAIRSSLGASRRQIACAVMTEGVLLAVAATACALLFSVWGIDAARVAVSTYVPAAIRASTIALDGRVFLAATSATLVTGVCASLVPAWQASRASVLGVIKDAGPTTTGSGRSWRSALLIGELACVSTLLVVSWLFVASLVHSVGIDLGVDRSHLLAVSPNTDFNGTVDEVQRRLEAVPGITGVAVAAGGASLPLIGRAFGGAWITTAIHHMESSGAASPVTVLTYRVTPNYFDIAGIRFRRGTTWTGEPLSAVLDERAATQLFGADDPIGRQIRVEEPAGVYTVIGIVPHVYARGPEDAVDPEVYLPLRAKPTRTFAGLFARTVRPAAEMVPMVSEALASLGPRGVKTPYVHAADEAVQRITATRRFNGVVMSVFGGLAILIGAAGIYGVVAAVVTQQTREIGVRVALGATPRRIRRRVLAQAGTHVVAGLALGLPIAWWVSRGLAAYLFEVTPADVAVYAGVAALVGAIGVTAALIPARRAARTDPMITLRA